MKAGVVIGSIMAATITGTVGCRKALFSRGVGGETPDAEIARYAEAHGRVLVTKDDDFALRHPPGQYRLLWLRCGDMGNRALSGWLIQRWLPISVKLEAGDPFIEVR